MRRSMQHGKMHRQAAKKNWMMKLLTTNLILSKASAAMPDALLPLPICVCKPVTCEHMLQACCCFVHVRLILDAAST